MREKITEKRLVETDVVISNKVICDVCGKEIKKQDFWRVTTHHYDWGPDIIESYEYYDCCSEECLNTKFYNYVEESAGGYNTMHFEVEHTRT